MSNGEPRGRWADAYDEAERGAADRYAREQAANVSGSTGGCCLVITLGLLAAFTLFLLYGIGLL